MKSKILANSKCPSYISTKPTEREYSLFMSAFEIYNDSKTVKRMVARKRLTKVEILLKIICKVLTSNVINKWLVLIGFNLLRTHIQRAGKNDTKWVSKHTKIKVNTVNPLYSDTPYSMLSEFFRMP